MRKPKSAPRAVIFDMDGVIVDSMPYHYLAWYEALKPFGIRVTCFDVYSKEGERWDKTLTSLFKKENIVPGKKLLARVFKIRKKIFRKYFKRSIFKGVEEFMGCLKERGYYLGLVTGTPEKEVKGILPERILRMFDSIVAGDHVKRGKPHPEPYLKAAKSLGLRPSECVVIENAPFGIESAKRAGMFCIALATSLPGEYLHRADRVANRLEDLLTINGKKRRVL